MAVVSSSSRSKRFKGVRAGPRRWCAARRAASIPRGKIVETPHREPRGLRARAVPRGVPSLARALSSSARRLLKRARMRARGRRRRAARARAARPSSSAIARDVTRPRSGAQENALRPTSSKRQTTITNRARAPELPPPAHQEERADADLRAKG